jgi:hypothetical protein
LNDDPTYVYVKGEGWIPRPDGDDFLCLYTDCVGKCWAVYERKPTVGEHWAVMWSGETIMDTLNWFTKHREDILNTVAWEYGFANSTDRYIVFVPYGQ